MILLIDNYDSFVHNLARYVGELGLRRCVARNDAITIEEVRALAPAGVILSPGPCTPDEAGICLELVAALHRELPLLGVCLGHQCIGQAFGWSLRPALRPVHGVATPIIHDGRALFTGLPSPLAGGRYHSLVVEPPPSADPRAPSPLRVSARSVEGEVMALAHEIYPTFGLQFHPESLLTDDGYALLGNFLAVAARWATRAPAPARAPLGARAGEARGTL